MMDDLAFRNEFYRSHAHVCISIQKVVTCKKCKGILYKYEERLFEEGDDFLVFPIKVNKMVNEVAIVFYSLVRWLWAMYLRIFFKLIEWNSSKLKILTAFEEIPIE